MILHAMTQPIPADERAADAESREVKIEAPTYDDAWAKLHAELPDGWRVLWVRSA